MRKFYLTFLLFSSVICTAQDKILTGSFENLKSINAYDVVFDYHGQKIAHFDTEEDFLKDKMGKREEESAEAFKERWFKDRETIYEPKFIAYFNKRMKNASVGKNTDALYTMHIKTTWIYPGYNVFVGREESKLSCILTVYETANPDNILFKIEYDKLPGIEPTEESYDPGHRIAGAYEKLAKTFTKQLKRFIK